MIKTKQIHCRSGLKIFTGSASKSTGQSDRMSGIVMQKSKYWFYLNLQYVQFKAIYLFRSISCQNKVHRCNQLC